MQTLTSRKQVFPILDRWASLWTCLCLPYNPPCYIYVWIGMQIRAKIALGWPQGWQMPNPGPRDWQGGKMLRSCLWVVGMHGCTCNWLMHYMFGNKPLHVQFVQFIIWTQGLGAAIWEYYGIFCGSLLCSFVSCISLFKQISLNFFNIIIKTASLIPNLISRTIPFARSKLM